MQTKHGSLNPRRPTPRIATFDVFDTVLTRSVGNPQAVFLLLGRRLYNRSMIRCTPEAFARARVDAMRRAWANVAYGEPTLTHIYAELGNALCLAEEERKELIQLELEIESELIRIIPGAKEFVNTIRASCRRIVFLSDMYVPSGFIRTLLVRHELWWDGDKIYVSCEHGKSKSSGGLFQEFLERERVPPSSICHRGNHLEADIRSPKQLGFDVAPFLDANINRYEEILESQAYATEGLSSVMAGASRLARLSIATSSRTQRTIRDVSAGAIAPAFVGCVLWMLLRARQLKMKRLYFLSRDGEVFLEIARRLADRLGYSCEFRYLYVSRESCYATSITKIDDETLHYIRRYKDRRSVQLMLEQIGLQPEEIREDLEDIGLGEERWSSLLNSSDVRKFCALLRDRPNIQELVLRQSQQKRFTMVKYFKQEGLFDSIKWGVVDIGWRGTIQNCLGKVLQSVGHSPYSGLYFGLVDNSLYNLPDHREGYFFDQRSNLGFVDLFPRQGIPRMIEMFSRADHGTVVSYDDMGNEVCPVLKEFKNQQLLDWGFSLMRKTIYAFAENLLLDRDLIGIEADVRGALAKVLEKFWIYPSRSEVIAFSKYPAELGLGHQNHSPPIVEVYGWRHVFTAAWSGKPIRSHPHIWDEGSLLLTPPHKRIGVRVAREIARRIRQNAGTVMRALSSRSKKLISSPLDKIF